MEIKLVKGDITKLEVDAIVNAANSGLMGGAGVDGAIHRAGGPAILDACIDIRNRHGKCSSGEAVITTAGNLKAKYVIHTVGPRWKSDAPEQAEELYHCYLNSLKLADEHQAKSIAFPNVSTGIYGYPKKEAAEIAWRAVNDYVATNIASLIFVCFDDENYNLYQRLVAQ